ncbi:MAG: YSC84-related protein [Candidatus Eremiobacteraeota bacterium]|nr:YSC84-related protein [Candidatus Eremiobacteraeota bacterium]
MRLTALMLLLMLCFSPPAQAGIFKKGKSPEEQRQAILKRSQDILSALYKARPGAKAAVEKAYGYATFSDFGIKILVAGTGRGSGVAVTNKTSEKVYMKMRELQAGLGFGVKKFMLIFVFDNEKAFRNFVDSGWTLGAQGTAAAKSGKTGGALQGAVPMSDGVWLYQLTEGGLALEVTVKGSKFSKDKNLNAKAGDAGGEKETGTSGEDE